MRHAAQLQACRTTLAGVPHHAHSCAASSISTPAAGHTRRGLVKLPRMEGLPIGARQSMVGRGWIQQPFIINLGSLTSRPHKGARHMLAAGRNASLMHHAHPAACASCRMRSGPNWPTPWNMRLECGCTTLNCQRCLIALPADLFSPCSSPHAHQHEAGLISHSELHWRGSMPRDSLSACWVILKGTVYA